MIFRLTNSSSSTTVPRSICQVRRPICLTIRLNRAFEYPRPVFLLFSTLLCSPRRFCSFCLSKCVQAKPPTSRKQRPQFRDKRRCQDSLSTLPKPLTSGVSTVLKVAMRTHRLRPLSSCRRINCPKRRWRH